MFELLSIIVSAIVSFLVAKYTTDRSVKEERKTRRETARLELCLSVTSLLSEVESNPERRAEDSFASEVCRINYFAKLNASGKLSSAIEKYSADYLRAFKIFKVNNMNLYNTWHSFDCWEDKDGNPVNPGHSLADEQGESGYISERQNLRAEFLNTTAHLWIAEHEICKLAIEEASTCGSDCFYGSGLSTRRFSRLWFGNDTRHNTFEKAMVEEVHEISKRGELLIAVTSGAVVTLVKSVVGGDGIALERVEAVISTLAKRDGVHLEVVAVFIISVHVAVAMTREVLRKASDHLRALTNAVHFFCLVMDDVGSREVALVPQCIAGV